MSGRRGDAAARSATSLTDAEKIEHRRVNTELIHQDSSTPVWFDYPFFSYGATQMKIRNRVLTPAVVMASIILGATSASAVIVCDEPDLPPGCGEYLTPAEVHVIFDNPDTDPAIVQAIMIDISHDRFLNP